MLFTSIPFLALLMITFVVYYVMPSRGSQVVALTLASFVFYSWESPYLLTLLIVSIAINVVTSCQVAKGRPALQKFWAIMGVALNLGVLLFFKYSPLFARTVLGGDHGSLGHFLMTIPLPIGISFFTFQGISLVIEVFRTTQPGSTSKYGPLPDLVPGTFREHLMNTMLFKSFFRIWWRVRSSRRTNTTRRSDANALGPSSGRTHFAPW